MDQPIAPQPASDALGAIAGMHRDVPETDGLWYASYPPDVPREIDVGQYASVAHFFDECTARFSGNP